MFISIGCGVGATKSQAQEEAPTFGVGDYVRRKSGRQNRGRVIGLYQGRHYVGDRYAGMRWVAKVRWENVYQRTGGGTSMVGPSIAAKNLVKVESVQDGK